MHVRTCIWYPGYEHIQVQELFEQHRTWHVPQGIFRLFPSERIVPHLHNNPKRKTIYPQSVKIMEINFGIFRIFSGVYVLGWVKVGKVVDVTCCMWQVNLYCTELRVEKHERRISLERGEWRSVG